MPIKSKEYSDAGGVHAWVVCASAALFFFYIFIQMTMFNAISPYLISAFSVNAEQLGQVSAGYFYGNVLCLFLAGMILDRVSTRTVILGSLSLAVLGTFAFGLSVNMVQAWFARFVIGIGGAFCFLSCVRLISRWFPPRRMALVIGLTVTLAMLGGMVAQTPLTLLTDAMGWRHALLVDGSFGVLILAFISMLVSDYPAGYDIANEHAHVNDLGFWRAIKAVGKNSQNWLGGVFTSMVNLPIFLFGALWGGMYLVQIRALTRSNASLVISMIFVGMIVGSPLFGWWSDAIRRRRFPMIVGGVITLITLLAIMYMPVLGFKALALLFFLLGLGMGSQVLGFPLVAESNPVALTGTAEGLASTLIMGAGLMQPVFGWLVEYNWTHQMLNHVPLYSVSEYRLAMSVMPIACIIGLLAAILAKETYCQHISTKVDAL